MRRPWFRPALGALAWIVACGSPETPRSPSQVARLAVNPERYVDDGPFRLVFAGPQGENASTSEVTLAFSRPLRAPGVIGPAIPAAGVRRVHDGAPVAGAWHWFGGRTAVFWPSEGFDDATEYEVTLEPGLRAFDGSALRATPPFRFSTERPALLSAAYSFNREAERHELVLEFNQPTPLDELQTSLRVEGKGANGPTVVPFIVDSHAEQRRFELILDRSVVGLADVQAITAPSLSSAAGPLRAGHEARVAIADLGPQRIELYCVEPGADVETSGAKRCSLERGSIGLRLAKSVRGRDLWRAFAASSPRRAPDGFDEQLISEVPLDSLMRLAPGRKYRITIKAGLTAFDQERLAQDVRLELETADLEPRLELRDVNDAKAGADVMVEAARPKLNFRITAMNVAGAEAALVPLGESLLSDRQSWSSVFSLPGAVTQRIFLTSTRNRQVQGSFELPAVWRAPGGTGAFALSLRAPGIAERSYRVLVTDLGLTTKWSAQGGLVWVTRLSTATPVAGARVSLRFDASEAFVGTTDAFGVVSIPADVAASSSSSPPLVVVRAGADLALAQLSRPSAAASRPVGLVFTDRRLYRPGETAFVKGMFRSPAVSGLVARPGQGLRIEALDRDGRTWFTSAATLDAFGSFSCEVPIPRSAPLGSASVRVRFDSEQPPWNAYFAVDEFRSVEMRLSVDADRAEYVAGDEARLAIGGHYLFGAPMHHAEVRLVTARRPASFSPPSLRDFTSDGAGFWQQAPDGVVEQRDVPLDGNGAAAPRVKLALPGQVGPETITVEAVIDDVSRSFAVAEQTTFTVHPSELYVGVRLDPNAPSPAIGQPFRVEVAAAGWADARRSGVPVHVELFQKLEGKAPSSLGRGCELVTAIPETGCSLSVNEPGEYWVTARALDSAGRVARAAAPFEVVKQEPRRPRSEPVAPPSPPEPPELPFDAACLLARRGIDDASLRVQGDARSRYRVGELVHGCLRGEGPGLVTEERDGLLEHRVLGLTRPGLLLDFPVQSRHYPSFSLGLHALSPRTRPFPARGQIDLGHPRYADYLEEIGVERPDDRNLVVAIGVGDEHRPGEAFDVRVRVTDPAGRPSAAQVTLWAVDEGLLELEPYRVPVPEHVFGDERWSSVITRDTRDQLLWERGAGVHHSAAPKVRMGGTQVGARSHVGRAVFRPTAWFLPRLLTGPDGVARARVKLPDNLTSWRVFAVAQTTGEAFGHAVSSFVTKQPLMARPALPRFLRAGDRFEAGFVIDSMQSRPLEVALELASSGAIQGGGQQRLTIPAQGHVPVRFPVRATGAGRARLALRASAPGGLSDLVVSDLDVSVPTTLETTVLSGQTSRRVDEPLGDLRRARPDVGGLELRIASTPLAGLAESLDGLVEYPYGCTEQLASRLVPWVRLRQLAKALAVELPPEGETVRTTLATLLTRQRKDGGFGFWPESSESEAWLTATVLSALLTSQRAGHAVPQAAVDRAVAWLDPAEHGDLPSRVLLEDVFASLGRPRADRLSELVGKPLPRFARALLAHALATTDTALARRVLDDVTSSARLTGATAVIADEPDLARRTYLSSDARTTALALRALSVLAPRDPLVPKLVQGLLSLRRNGRWLTTQESAWALVALDDLRQALGPPNGGAARLGAWFGGVAVAQSHGTGVARGSLTIAQLLANPGASLAFTSDGAPLYYEAALRYARREAPSSPLEQGIHVARSLKIERRGAAVPVRDLRVGDGVEVDVVLASAVPRELVVLDDPIPAGFEAVNRTFANTEAGAGNLAGGVVTHRELRDDRVVSYFDRLPAGVTHTSYRLRAIAAGRFAHPAAKAECMYTPDVFGRTAASSVEVR